MTSRTLCGKLIIAYTSKQPQVAVAHFYKTYPWDKKANESVHFLTVTTLSMQSMCTVSNLKDFLFSWQ